MFKNFTLVVCTLLFSITFVFSQSKLQFTKSNPKTLAKSTVESIEFRSDTVIIDPPAFSDPCAESVFIFFLNEEAGFLNGTNDFGDQAKAQRFDFDDASSYSVIGAFIAFGNITVAGDGTIKVGVWDADENGAPQTLLYETTPVNVSQLSPNDGESIEQDLFVFPPSDPVMTNQFFISVDLSNLYETGDMLSLWSTDENCGDASSTWELLIFEDGATTWNPYDGTGVFPDFNLPIDLLVSPIIVFDNTTSIESQFVTKNGLTLLPASPNPAKNQAFINFELDQPEQVQIALYNMEGQLIRQEELGSISSGPQSKVLNVEDLQAGSYIYSIVTNRARLMSRLVIVD